MVQNLLPDITVNPNLLELAWRYRQLVFLKPHVRGNQTSASVLQMPSVKHLVNHGVDRLAQAFKQSPKADVVKPALGVWDKAVLDEIVAARNAGDALAVVLDVLNPVVRDNPNNLAAILVDRDNVRFSIAILVQVQKAMLFEEAMRRVNVVCVNLCRGSRRVQLDIQERAGSLALLDFLGIQEYLVGNPWRFLKVTNLVVHHQIHGRAHLGLVAPSPLRAPHLPK